MSAPDERWYVYAPPRGGDLAEGCYGDWAEVFTAFVAMVKAGRQVRLCRFSPDGTPEWAVEVPAKGPLA